MLPNPTRGTLLCLLCGALMLLPGAAPAATDQDYIDAFNLEFTRRENPAALAEYATQRRFDELYMGSQAEFMNRIRTELNEDGAITWTFSYRLDAYAEMYRITGERKYLTMLRDYTRLLLEVRDDALGLKVWGETESPPIWGEGERYSGVAGRRIAIPEHTGVIVWPMFEFLRLAKGDPLFMEKLGNEYQSIRSKLEESLDYHIGRQWLDGPSTGEGCFIHHFRDPWYDGKPIALHGLSSTGRALWVAWKATGREDYRDKALRIGHYIRNRLRVDPQDRAYYWTTYLPEEPIAWPPVKGSLSGGEDMSHGALSVAFPLMLAQEGQIFSRADGIAFANTFMNGAARLDTPGVLYGNLLGVPIGNLSAVAQGVRRPARWLVVTPYESAAYGEVADFFLHYVSTPSDLDLALLISYRPAQPRSRVRDFCVYE